MLDMLYTALGVLNQIGLVTLLLLCKALVAMPGRLSSEHEPHRGTLPPGRREAQNPFKLVAKCLAQKQPDTFAFIMVHQQSVETVVMALALELLQLLLRHTNAIVF